MASKIFNYSKKSMVETKYGQTIDLTSKKSPFLGVLKEGEMIQVSSDFCQN
jgi:hypothetical protein